VLALIERVRGVLVDPRRTLPLTLAESGAPASVFFPYVAVLAALGPIAIFLSNGLVGAWHAPVEIFNARIPGGWTRAPLLALLLALAAYVVFVGAWAGLAEAFRWSAPWFGGLRDRGSAWKASAYALTPIWLAGATFLFDSVPYLNWLPGVALVAGVAWAAFVGVVALPLHLGTPDAKAPGHALASLGATSLLATAVYFGASKALYSLFSAG
jgi:hypothetical protein